MATKNLAVQNDVIVLKVPQARSQVATLATKSTVDAGAVFVIETEHVTGEWMPTGVFDAVAQAAADNITGPLQWCWTDVPGAQNVRVRRTDANGNDGTVAFNVVEV